MTYSTGGMGLLGAGWLLQWAVLYGMSETELGIAIGTLVLAECLSAAIWSGAVLNDLHSHRRSTGQETWGRALLGWLIACFVVIAASQLYVLPFFDGHPFAILCLLALTLVLTLIKLVAVVNRYGKVLLAGRLLITAGMMQMTILLGGQDADVILVSVIFAYLVILLCFANRAVGHNRIEPKNISQIEDISAGMCRYSDLFVLPILLAGPEAVLYFIARCISLIVTFSLEHVGYRAEPALQTAIDRSDGVSFVRMAARLNLGFLLIGGAVCLAVLAVAPYVRLQISHSQTDFLTILDWLLLGVSAPVVFGATHIFLKISEQDKAALFYNFTAAILLSAAMLSNAEPSALFLAKCFAIMQWLNAGTSALHLIRYNGVWPGLTALLLRQIRLL